jgi:penicillin-binding protein 2
MLKREEDTSVKKSAEPELEVLRIHVVLLGMVLGLLFIAGSLWRIQVAGSEKYEGELDNQSIRCVRLPGIRGRVFDRNGVCLAENRPSYCIAIYLEQLRPLGSLRRTSMFEAVEELVQRLSKVMGLPPEMSSDAIKRHIKIRSPMPLLAWRDVGEGPAARLEESSENFPAVSLYLQPVRTYPLNDLGSHVIGYVTRSYPQDEEGRDYDYYLPDSSGRRGIERTLDGELRGHPGGKLVRVDASGLTRELPGDDKIKRFDEPPISGSDIMLTLDARIQRLAEEIIGGEKSAVVVLDPRNGDVLALASQPSFNLNLFSGGISSSAWNALLRHPAHPLQNRAVSGRYPPGSIFKPVVAIAGLESDRGIRPSTAFQCPGYYQLGSTSRLRCWNWKYGGHGLLRMQKAIEQSCNTYFCSLGAKTGYRAIRQTAKQLGLGQRTGIELDAENSGNLPDVGDVKYKGEVANVSIGQGPLLVTPLQMAVLAATIANGGNVYRPRLVLATRPDLESGFEEHPPHLTARLKWSAETTKTVRNGMLDVIHAKRGTGKRAKVEGLRMAGKTGTAEYGRRGEGKKHTWMIAFAPFDNPRFAVAMIVEDGVSGGRTVAPRIHELMSEIVGLTSDGV